MELEQKYEISRTAEFIHSRNFNRIALQFPDEFLKDSTKVSKALKEKLHSLKERSDDSTPFRLCVMADTTYGSCCVDEVGASHIDAHCVVHYGHTCLSPTSKIPAFFVFGKACVDASLCAKSLLKFSASSNKTIVVLHGLEYAHAIPHVKEKLVAELSERPESETRFVFADVTCSEIEPQKNQTSYEQCESNDDSHLEGRNRHKIGGLVWDLPIGKTMEDCLLLWIGSDNSAFANVVLTFNTCEIVRYDVKENQLVTDFSQQRRILKRRYYLVEKAKDANIVGIVVGTLGVAGYLDMIHKMKDLITGVGKKAYTLVMGRPNPAKLANFPECDVFIYVSCAQTALLDSKEFLAPVITPFEAMLAFNRGSEWTGEYVMEFRDLINESPVAATKHSEEARFSFIEGRYVEDIDLQEREDEDGVLALAKTTEKALQLRDGDSASIIKRTIKSGAEYYATRTCHGLEMHNNNAMPEQYLIGRSGKASGYQNEKQEAG